MIGLPPSSVGATQVRAAELSFGAPVSPVGAGGAVGGDGVTALEGAESEPVPEPFVAATVKV